MARPKARPGKPDARERLESACWELLETRSFHELTIDSVAERARCSRGTFYYHYRDMDGLFRSVVDRELARDGLLHEGLLRLALVPDAPGGWEACAAALERLRLVVERGGLEIVRARAAQTVAQTWRALLCPDGAELTDEARSVIEFAVCGLLGLAASDAALAVEGDEQSFVASFMESVAAFVVSSVSEAQNVPLAVVRERAAVAFLLMQGQRREDASDTKRKAIRSKSDGVGSAS